MDHDPGPELLAARERLLEGIMATWRQPAPVTAQAPAAPVVMIPLAAAMAAEERYRLKWSEALAEKQAALAEAASQKRSPGDGYWKREHHARALYGAALLLLGALMEDQR